MGATSGHNKTTREPRAYRCFLIRCRQEESGGTGGDPIWRFTVQEADHSGPRRCFACLDDVEVYLEAELGQPGRVTRPNQ